MKRVAFIELNLIGRSLPLVSGYLHASALESELIRDNYCFEYYSRYIGGDDSFSKIAQIEADVYAFSCYVWNMGLVKKAVEYFEEKYPEAHFILGGPQVINKADRYLSENTSRRVLCNGEGEFTFKEYLIELLSDNVDFSHVKGLSYVKNNTIITNESAPRIKDLNEIPSPFLEGCFKPKRYYQAVLETNRGCPFKCTYCFWGAATAAKVNKYSEDRVFDEITWLAKNQVKCLVLADANFGMLKRDIDIARHIVKCKDEYGYPEDLMYSPSKNTLERNSEIREIFNASGLSTSYSIAVQSLNPDTLKNIKRENIKSETYIGMQEELNSKGIDSWAELIWPLPSETLSTFKDGLVELCDIGAGSFLVYPPYLLNNSELELHVEQFDLKTMKDLNPNGEGIIIIATKDVTETEYFDGLEFYYHLSSLHSVGCLKLCSDYLSRTGKMSRRELFERFVEYCNTLKDNVYVEHVRKLLRHEKVLEWSSPLGETAHLVCFENRQEFDDLLFDFIRTLDCWGDQKLALLFEFDLLNRPWLYTEPMKEINPDYFRYISILEQAGNVLSIEVNENVSIISEYLSGLLEVPASGELGRVDINYAKTKTSVSDLDSDIAIGFFCEDRMRRMSEVKPEWSARNSMIEPKRSISKAGNIKQVAEMIE